MLVPQTLELLSHLPGPPALILKARKRGSEVYPNLTLPDLPGSGKAGRVVAFDLASLPTGPTYWRKEMILSYSE